MSPGTGSRHGGCCRRASEATSVGRKLTVFPAWFDLGASQAAPALSPQLCLLHRVPCRIVRRGWRGRALSGCWRRRAPRASGQGSQTCPSAHWQQLRPCPRQRAASSGTARGPKACELCHPARALASGKCSTFKCLLHQLTKWCFTKVLKDSKVLKVFSLLTKVLRASYFVLKARNHSLWKR